MKQTNYPIFLMLLVFALLFTAITSQTCYHESQFIQGNNSYPNLDITDDVENLVFALNLDGHSYLKNSNVFRENTTF